MKSFELLLDQVPFTYNGGFLFTTLKNTHGLIIAQAIKPDVADFLMRAVTGLPDLVQQYYDLKARVGVLDEALDAQESGPFRCCECCVEDPDAHEDGAQNHHEVICSTCEGTSRSSLLLKIKKLESEAANHQDELGEAWTEGVLAGWDRIGDHNVFEECPYNKKDVTK